jgi:hypothetical protein
LLRAILRTKLERIIHYLHIRLDGTATCSCGKWGIKEKDVAKIRHAFEGHKEEVSHDGQDKKSGA